MFSRAKKRFSNLELINHRDRDIIKQKIQKKVLNQGGNSRRLFHRISSDSSYIPKVNQSFIENLRNLNFSRILNNTALQVNQQIRNNLTKPTGAFLELLIANLNSMSLLKNRESKKEKESDKLKPLQSL